MKYKDFIINENEKKYKYDKKLFKLVLNDIFIDIDHVIYTLNQFNISSWFIYNDDNNITLEYYSLSDISDENIEKIQEHFHENLPYFYEMIIHKDDRRIVIKLFDVGYPIKFKFVRN